MMQWRRTLVGVVVVWLILSGFLLSAPAHACGIGQPFTMLANAQAAVPYPFAQASASSPLGIFPQVAVIGQQMAFSELTPPTLVIAAYDWRWDFGDASQQESATPTATHLFLHPGVFVVKLWLSSHASPAAAPQMIDSAELTVVARRLSDPPSVQARASASVVMLGDAITYDATGSQAREGGAITYLWNFGDGQTASTPIVTHRFLQLGSGSVVLLAQDARGARTVVSFAIRVVVRPSAPIIQAPMMTSAGQPTQFHLLGESATTAWAAVTWDFGDGATLSGDATDVTHQYARPGSYMVTAQVTTVDGLTQVATFTTHIKRGSQSVSAISPVILVISGLCASVIVISAWLLRRRMVHLSVGIE